MKGEPILNFFSFNMLIGLVAMYCITEFFRSKFQDEKYKFIAGLFGVLLGGYVLGQLIK
jgi:hypothetical protein